MTFNEKSEILYDAFLDKHSLNSQKKFKMFKYQISFAYPYIVIFYKNTI